MLHPGFHDVTQARHGFCSLGSHHGPRAQARRKRLARPLHQRTCRDCTPRRAHLENLQPALPPSSELQVQPEQRCRSQQLRFCLCGRCPRAQARRQLPAIPNEQRAPNHRERRRALRQHRLPRAPARCHRPIHPQRQLLPQPQLLGRSEDRLLEPSAQRPGEAAVHHPPYDQTHADRRDK
eukprot:scaffold18589_cov53-Phaeocystis_antarctica.AAC.1